MLVIEYKHFRDSSPDTNLKTEKSSDKPSKDDDKSITTEKSLEPVPAHSRTIANALSIRSTSDTQTKDNMMITSASNNITTSTNKQSDAILRFLISNIVLTYFCNLAKLL